jgi:hypothetical protein
MKMNEHIKISGDTPLNCESLKKGNLYCIRLPDPRTMIGVLRKATILSLEFDLIMDEDVVFRTPMPYKVPVMDIVDDDDNFCTKVFPLSSDEVIHLMFPWVTDNETV